jgi:nucleotide-binding universal stress UspA family protein
MSAIKKIVVGTDFNELAAAALRFAGGIASRTGAELLVVYADTFEPPAEFTSAQVRHLAETIERSKQRTREQLEAHVAKHVPKGVPWKAIVADDLPASAIARMAETDGADFIAVGTHGRGGLQRLVVGSVAEALIGEARVPVLTVRSTELPSRINRVFCPINASDVAAEAARRAENVAGALGAELTLLHAGATEILRIADSSDYDLIVLGAEHKLVRQVTRHAHTPVLTVTEHVVDAKRRTA